MINIDFNIPSPATVKDRLTKGYHARRNFLVLEFLSMVVAQTPKKTGLATGNWRISVGKKATGVLERKDLVGDQVVNEELSALRGSSAFATIHIGNNLGYIEELEEGSSGQAPDGILRVVVPAFRSIYGDVI